MVVENPAHIAQPEPLEGVRKIGVPDSETLEAGARRRGNTLLETRSAVVMIGVRHGARGERPVGGEQINVLSHSRTLRCGEHCAPGQPCGCCLAEE